MKINIYKILLLIIFPIIIHAQSKSYKVRYQSFINGDVRVVGNNIVNRSKSFASANVPFNELGIATKHNDEFYMKYIDVDNDPKTFSSSSAYLDLPLNTSKIVYAGLYWAGIYSCDEIISKENNEFEVKQASRKAFNEALLKVPNVDIYQLIKGEIIFDGRGQEEYKNSAPYVVYANITDIIKAQTSAKGEYTVANVRATQGTVLGGVSAGWMLVVVYEQENTSLKKIVTYDGFKDIYRGKFDIDFKEFKTPENGNVEIRLLGAALEGDHSISGSSLLISSSEKKRVYVFNEIRPKRNFFNSSITFENTFLDKRKPNSKNTLGFDIFDIEVPNMNNEIVGNNISDVKLSMFAKNDRYYSFFTALSISSKVDTIIKEDKHQKLINQITEFDTIKKRSVTDQLIDIRKKKLKSSPKVEKDNIPIVMNSKLVPSGYYNIIGVFSNPSNRDRFIRSIKQKGYSPKFFYNPENELNYIYIYFTNNLEKSRENRDLLRNKEVFTRIWILYVKK